MSSPQASAAFTTSYPSTTCMSATCLEATPWQYVAQLTAQAVRAKQMCAHLPKDNMLQVQPRRPCKGQEEPACTQTL